MNGEIGLLRESVRETLASWYPGTVNEEWPESWVLNWDVLAQQGFWSTVEPPDGSLAAAAAVVEELGRALYPGPACEALAAAYLLNGLSDAGLIRAVAGVPTAVFVVAEGLLVKVPPETLLVDGRWRFRRRRCQFLTSEGLSDAPPEMQ